MIQIARSPSPITSPIAIRARRAPARVPTYVRLPSPARERLRPPRPLREPAYVRLPECPRPCLRTRLREAHGGKLGRALWEVPPRKWLTNLAFGWELPAS
jgi:hypothetical protein